MTLRWRVAPTVIGGQPVEVLVAAESRQRARHFLRDAISSGCFGPASPVMAAWRTRPAGAILLLWDEHKADTWGHAVMQPAPGSDGERELAAMLAGIEASDGARFPPEPPA